MLQEKNAETADVSKKQTNMSDKMEMKRINEQDIFQNRLQKIDKTDKRHLLTLYQKYEDSWVRPWAKYLSFTGDPRLWAPTLLIFGIYGLFIQNFTLLVAFAMAFLQSYLIYYIIKHYIAKRPRPFEQHSEIELLDKTGHGYSFPSGHTHHSTILLGMIWLMFLPANWFIIVILIYNCIIGYTRMVSGCHYLSDVIFAALEAYAELFFYWYVTMDLYLNFYEMVFEFIPFF